MLKIMKEIPVTQEQNPETESSWFSLLPSKPEGVHFTVVPARVRDSPVGHSDRFAVCFASQAEMNLMYIRPRDNCGLH